MVQNIDAAVFQRMMIHAHAAINIQKQSINDLNVFPVPDPNRTLTIGAAAAEMRKKHYDTVGQAAVGTASALLRGARGNSGVILSLLFRGLSKAIKEKETMDGRDPPRAPSSLSPVWPPPGPPATPGRTTPSRECWRPPSGRARRRWSTPSTRTRC